MPRTKTRPKPKPASAAPAESQSPAPVNAIDVLNLAEAAAYLRVSEDDVLRMVREQELPARMVGTQWRFLKSAVQTWLSSPSAAQRKEAFWSMHFGALKDDPYLEEMLQDIYKRRGRPEVEEP